MSASISLSIAEHNDLEPQIRYLYSSNQVKGSSLRLSIEDKNNSADIERRHTGLGSTLRSQLTVLELDESSNKLKRWPYRPQRMSSNDSREETFEGTYFEELASYNDSFDGHVDIQYVNKWLDGGSTGMKEALHIGHRRSASLTRDGSLELVNTIRGIRLSGNWLSDTSLRSSNNQTRSQESLKEDLAKLKSDYRRLTEILSKTKGRFEKISSVGTGLIELKREILLLNDQCKHDKIGLSDGLSSDKIQQDTSIQKIQQEVDALKLECKKFELDLKQGTKLSLDSLEREISSKDSEISSLRELIDRMTKECDEDDLKQLLDLRRENTILKKTNDGNVQEIDRLKVKFDQLNKQFHHLSNIQCQLEEEVNLQRVNLQTEESSLRDKSLKLEQIVDTEREIQKELQIRSARLNNDNERLKQDLEAMTKQYFSIKTKKQSSNEIEQMRTELDRVRCDWQGLISQRDELNQQLSNTKSLVQKLDRDYLDEAEKLKMSFESQLELSNSNKIELEIEKQQIIAQMADLEEELKRSNLERDELQRQMLNTKSDLEIHDLDLTNKFKEALEEKKKVISSVEERLHSLSEDTERMRELLKDQEKQLANSKEDYKELQEKFLVQQSEFKASSDRKEIELSKLRQALNLERYERQVMKREIDRELRSSLNELETMKYRLLRRLLVSSSNGSTCLKQQRGLTNTRSESNDIERKQHRQASTKSASKARVQFDSGQLPSDTRDLERR